MNHLLFADDLLLICENEHDSQTLLDILSQWCRVNKMTINSSKTKVMHFRPNSIPRTQFKFICGSSDIECVSEYRYLGLVLNETLDYSVTAKYVAQSATRALGLVISKAKAAGGLPYDVYTKLYDTLVWPIIDYGSSIWGTTEYACINAVQNRACRFFLGVGRYTPNAAVNGDMGWSPPVVRQWKTVLSHWFRLNNMAEERANKTIFKWAHTKMYGTKNWCFRVHSKVLKVIGLSLDVGLRYSYSDRKHVINSFINDVFNEYQESWRAKINVDTGRNKNCGNKLRTYKLLKHMYEPEPYTQISILPGNHRSALAKFRCGIAPLKVETGRFQGIPLQERTCFCCEKEVENEIHVLMSCPLYTNERDALFKKISSKNNSFLSLSDTEKFVFILSEAEIIRHSSKTCHDILSKRRAILYK